VRWIDDESQVETVDRQTVQATVSILSEVGSRLSDVFGADRVLWVEGPTEERCFPLIIRKFCPIELPGTIVRHVFATGDFDARDKEKVISVYERLTTSQALIPPALGFIFDSDGRSLQKKEDLKKRADARVFFLNRRLYENYLIHIGAICACLRSQTEFHYDGDLEIDVEKWIIEHFSNEKYFDNKKENVCKLDHEDLAIHQFLTGQG
jgi:hypothetical protein